VRFADNVSVSSFDLSDEDGSVSPSPVSISVSNEDFSLNSEPTKGILKVPVCRYYAHKQLEKESREQTSFKGKMRRFMSRSKSPNTRSSPFARSTPKLRRRSSFGDFEEAVRGDKSSLSVGSLMSKTKSGNNLRF
jgi:hypothetical protein